MADRNPDGTFAVGHANQGAGRPPRAVEAAMLDDIAKHFTGANRAALFAGWQRQIDRGNPKAIELALSYLAGKPRTDINLGGIGGGLNIVVEYIDAAAAETVAEAEDEDSEQ